MRDKVVFIGSSSAGLNDLHHTLFDAQMPGVKALAAMVENFIQDNTIIEPAWAKEAIVASSILTGMLITLLFVLVSNAALVVGASVLLGSALLVASFSTFTYAGIFLTPAPAVVTALLLLTLFSAIRFAIEKRTSSIFFQQLVEVRRVVNETLDEAHISRKAIEAACELLECRAGTVGMLRDGKVLFREYVKDGIAKAIDYSQAADAGVSGYVLQKRHPYISNDAGHDRHVTSGFCQLLGFGQLINVPVFDGDGEVIGCLEIHDRLDGAGFDDQDIEILESLSGIVGSALVNARLLENNKRSEQEITTAAERLNRILDADFDAVIAHKDFKVIYANKAAQKMFGYLSLEQTLGRNPLDYVAESYRKKAILAVKATVRRGKAFGPIEIEALRPQTGEVFPIEIASTPIVWENSPAVVSIVRDITERKAREEGMRLLESAVASISESVMITDPKGKIVYVNPSFVRNTGYTVQEALGNTPAILNSRQQSREFYKHFWETISEGEVWRGRILNRKKDGTIYPAHVAVAPIFDALGEISHFVAIYEDLSESEAFQKKMMQAQKMEAVGTMVGGLAHDFNNMLASIVGNLYLMGFGHEDDKEMMERISSMEDSVHHAANMIRQMLTFARKDGPEKQPMDMTVFIKEAYKLANAALPENVSFRLNYPTDGLHICTNSDATQLQQVLLNMVTNAHHAVINVEKPEIALELDREVPPAGVLELNHEIRSDTGWCRIRCSDNGCGMSSDTLEHIFEPFFTTKGVGEGTGLGLAMVYGAIQNHHGIIDVDSAPGQGTKISIWLPLYLEAVAPVVAGVDEFSVDGSGKTVLLVDDEQELRGVLAEVLRRSKFSVLLASDGEQAVDLFRSRLSQIDLVLMDVVMPNKGGLLAAKEIRDMDAYVPIIFQTGYGEKTQLEAVASVSFSSALKKPVQISELLKKMAEMIAEHDGKG